MQSVTAFLLLVPHFVQTFHFSLSNEHDCYFAAFDVFKLLLAPGPFQKILIWRTKIALLKLLPNYQA